MNLLYRAKQRVTDVLSAFGGIRETNITAMLGYFIEPNLHVHINLAEPFPSVRQTLRNFGPVYKIGFLNGGVHNPVLVPIDIEVSDYPLPMGT